MMTPSYPQIQTRESLRKQCYRKKDRRMMKGEEKFRLASDASWNRRRNPPKLEGGNMLEKTRKPKIGNRQGIATLYSRFYVAVSCVIMHVIKPWTTAGEQFTVSAN